MKKVVLIIFTIVTVFFLGTSVLLRYLGIIQINNIVIGIHIPSDAKFSPTAIDDSLQSASGFFAEHYPELDTAEYRCHSWLWDSQLKGIYIKAVT